MKINSVTSFTSPKFGALKTAVSSCYAGDRLIELDIYELFNDDRKFLQNLAEKTNFKKLAPNLKKESRERWQHIFNYGLTRAFKDGNKTYFAAYQNKPCGFLTFYNDNNNIVNLDCICSIPPKAGQKVPFLGKALIFYLFFEAFKNNSRGIKLKAVTNGPFNIIEKYKNLGFKEEKREHSQDYISMFCNPLDILYQLNELFQLFEMREYHPKQHYNLNTLLY